MHVLEFVIFCSVKFLFVQEILMIKFFILIQLNVVIWEKKAETGWFILLKYFKL